jgi:hypothetical protein
MMDTVIDEKSHDGRARHAPRTAPNTPLMSSTDMEEARTLSNRSWTVVPRPI